MSTLFNVSKFSMHCLRLSNIDKWPCKSYDEPDNVVFVYVNKERHIFNNIMNGFFAVKTFVKGEFKENDES